ncbi:thiol-disulfide oxidoreductase DCC family protein [Halocola ammonii]
MTTKADHTKPIVFYDGTCGFCNRTVNLLLEADREGNLRYAALQGKTAEELLPKDLREDLDTFVLWDGETSHTKSDAALEVIRYLPKRHRWLRIFRFIPGFIRNGVYSLIAKYRYRIFGRIQSCRLPEPDQRVLFLP